MPLAWVGMLPTTLWRGCQSVEGQPRPFGSPFLGEEAAQTQKALPMDPAAENVAQMQQAAAAAAFQTSPDAFLTGGFPGVAGQPDDMLANAVAQVTALNATSVAPPLSAQGTAPYTAAVSHGDMGAGMALPADQEAQVQEFALKWSLPPGAMQWLRSLDESVRQVVIAEFAPRRTGVAGVDNRDLLKMLYAFGRSINNRRATAMGAISPSGNAAPIGQASTPEEAIANFAAWWSLDEAAVEWLKQLEPAVRDTVIAEFAPRYETGGEVTRLLFAFARSVQARHTSAASMSDEMRQFAHRWNLDNATVGWMLQLQPRVRDTVMREFAPRDGGDTAAKLRAFSRSVEARQPVKISNHHDPRCQQFIDYWKLEDNAIAALESLAPAVQKTVIDQFDPRGGANVNAKFIAYARSISARVPVDPNVTVQQPAVQMPRQKTGNMLIDSFCQYWGMDNDTVQYLLSLPQSMCTEIINRFDPMPGTQDINRKLRGFAKSIVGGGVGQYPAAVQQGGGGCAGVTVPPRVVPPAGGMGAPQRRDFSALGSEEEEFCTKWSFPNVPAAVEILYGLAPDVRDKVMREFAPSPRTRDVFKLFVGFANSLSRAAADGVPMGDYNSYSASADADGGGYTMQQADPLFDTGGQQQVDPESFADYWQLDEGSRALLRGLSDDVKAVVIAEFDPRGPFHDIGGKFCSFARAVASRNNGGGAASAGGKGVKRVAPANGFAGVDPASKMARPWHQQ